MSRNARTIWALLAEGLPLGVLAFVLMSTTDLGWWILPILLGFAVADGFFHAMAEDIRG